VKSSKTPLQLGHLAGMVSGNSARQYLHLVPLYDDLVAVLDGFTGVDDEIGVVEAALVAGFGVEIACTRAAEGSWLMVWRNTLLLTSKSLEMSLSATRDGFVAGREACLCVDDAPA